MSWKYYLVFIVVTLAITDHCWGQDGRKLSEQITILDDCTKKRNFDQLMDSISTSDDGNFDLVMVASGDSAGLRHARSSIKGTIYDPRVRKLYELASQMTEKQAATKIEHAFRQKLKEYKSTGGSPPKQHGLHSTLFLAFEFCNRETSTQLLTEWVDWSRVQLLTGEYKKNYQNVQISNHLKKTSFFKSNSPELLMTASLILNDQIRQGKTTDEAVDLLTIAFAKAGWEEGLPDLVFQDLTPYGADEAKEPLTTVATFASWGSLDRADIDLQIKLIDTVRDFLAPQGVEIEVIETSSFSGLPKTEDEKEDKTREVVK